MIIIDVFRLRTKLIFRMTKSNSMEALEGNIVSLMGHLNNEPTSINKIDSDGRTLLHWASNILFLNFKSFWWKSRNYSIFNQERCRYKFIG